MAGEGAPVESGLIQETTTPTTADYANVRWLRRISKGKRYEPSIRDRILRAKSKQELHAIVADNLKTHCSSGTRRKWRQAMEAKMLQFNKVKLHG